MNEPNSYAAVLSTLRREKAWLQKYHGVAFHDQALKLLAAGICSRYSGYGDEACMKAVDLLDLIGARQRLIGEHGTLELLPLQDAQEVLILRIQSLSQDLPRYRDNIEEFDRITAKLSDLARELEGVKKQIVIEETRSKFIQGKIRVTKFNIEADAAEASGDLERASQLRNAVIPYVQQELNNLGVMENFEGVVGEREVAVILSEQLGGTVADYENMLQ